MLIKPEPQVLATAAPRLDEEGAGGGACAAQKRGRDVTTPHDEEEGEEGARPAALNLSTAAAHQSLSSLYAQQERKMTLKQVGVFATWFPLVLFLFKISVPDAGSGAFFTPGPDPGSGIGFFPDPGSPIPDPNLIFFRA
jgi:hypothetical protein